MTTSSRRFLRPWYDEDRSVKAVRSGPGAASVVIESVCPSKSPGETTGFPAWVRVPGMTTLPRTRRPNEYATLDATAAKRKAESDAHTRRLKSDFEFFCLTMLKINPKVKELQKEGAAKGVLIPFKWNKAQRRTWILMQSLIAQGLPIKLVVLK